MNIVIVGGGLVGSTLAAKLSGDGHDVTLVERQGTKVRSLQEAADIQVVEGNGATAPVLRGAGIAAADLLVASTDSDEANLVVGLIAMQQYRVPRVVVRLRDPSHGETFSLISARHAGEHVHVNPEAAAVDRIFALLEVPGAVDVVSFLDGQLLIAGFRIAPESDFAGLDLAHMRLMFPSTPTLVVAVHRGNEWIVPGGKEEIRAGDVIYFAITRGELDAVLGLLGGLRREDGHVMIAGAHRIGLDLARRLEATHGRVVLIEEDSERARRAAEVLSQTLVITGGVTDQALLEEEDIEKVGTFVALTDDHETNLVASLLAKRLGAARAFALVDNPSMATLIGEIGIDAVISPRLLAIGLTLQHIRRGRVRSVAALPEDRVEVIELEAVADSRLTSAPLAAVDLPRGVIIAALRRGERLFLPGGADCVQAGDIVLVVTTTEMAPALDRFLSP